MALYYIISNDEFLYSGVQFAGSTELNIGLDGDGGTSTLPTTSTTTTIKPYDGNLVEWIRGTLPKPDNNGKERITLIDYSGIKLTSNCSFSSNGGERLEKFIFPRDCAKYLTSIGTTGDNGAVANGLLANSPRFTTVSSVEYGDEHLPDLPYCTSMGGAFRNCSDLVRVHFHAMDRCTTLTGLFAGCEKLTSPIFHNDWTSVATTRSMFSDCAALSSFVFPEGRHLTVMRYMFSGCTSLVSIVLPNGPDAYDDSSVAGDLFNSNYCVQSQGLFSGCTSLTSVTIPEGARLRHGSDMFKNCSSLQSVNIPFIVNGWCANMFEGCTSLRSVNIGYVRCYNDSITAYTTSANTHSNMFKGCINLQTVNIGYFMYAYTTPNPTCTINNMFDGCENLVTINCNGFLGGYNEINGTNVFKDCDRLVGGSGTVWDIDEIGADYAHIDGGSGNPGYFTGVGDIPDTLVTATTRWGIISGQGYYPTGSSFTLKLIPIRDIGADYWIKWNDTTQQWEKVADGDTYTGIAAANERIYCINKYVGSSGADVIVSLSSSPVEGGTVEGSGLYLTGSDVTIKANPNEGYIFKGWYEIVGGEQVFLNSNAQYTIFGIGRNYNIVGVFEDKSNPYSGMEPVVGGGGNGSFDYNSDDINQSLFSSKMNNTADSSATIYVAGTVEDMNGFLSTFYIEDWADAIKTIVDKIATLGGNPMDYIQRIYVLPVGVQYISDNPYQFNMGIYDSVLQERALRIARQRIQIKSMGQLKVEELYGNSLDYNSEIQIWLPYIGYQKLDARTVMGKTLNLFYIIDLMNGDCVADIIATSDDGKFNSLIYQFTGNMAFNLPITSDNRLSDTIKEIATTAGKVGITAALLT